MRVISSDYKMDFPYERVILACIEDDVDGYPVKAVLNEELFSTVGRYSTFEKALEQMNLCQTAYCSGDKVFIFAKSDVEENE